MVQSPLISCDDHLKFLIMVVYPVVQQDVMSFFGEGDENKVFGGFILHKIQEFMLHPYMINMSHQCA